MIGVVPDPVLGPLLERLAVLEAANYRLRSGLSDRHFNAEVENAALREQLAGAKEEVARHQALCESLACELLAAAQARDRAQAAAEENAKTRAQAVSERDGLRVELDALKAIVEEDKGLKTRAALVAQRDGLRLALDEARKAGAEAALRAQELERRLTEALARPAAPAAASVEYPGIEYALESGWGRLLRLVKPPIEAAYGHLRRLSTGPMSAGQRAVLRLTGSSLSQAADALATIELALADGAAATEAAPILPVLESALAAWDAVFRRRGISLLRENFSVKQPDAPHDPAQLRLALHHVLRNALEALPQGATVRVRLGRSAADSSARLEFLDDGPGYPPAWLERRFEPFVSPRPGHAGLGLAAVRRALRRWGGDASAANAEKGSGACLTLTFAASPPRPAEKS